MRPAGPPRSAWLSPEITGSGSGPPSLEAPRRSIREARQRLPSAGARSSSTGYPKRCSSTRQWSGRGFVLTAPLSHRSNCRRSIERPRSPGSLSRAASSLAARSYCLTNVWYVCQCRSVTSTRSRLGSPDMIAPRSRAWKPRITLRARVVPPFFAAQQRNDGEKTRERR